MAHLIDPLPDDAARLVEIIWEGFEANGGAWPTWQYADLRAHADGIDAAATARAMPGWQHNYGPLRPAREPREPAPAVCLTVHGMVHARRPTTNPYLQCFTAAVRTGAQHQLSVEPRPDAVVPLHLPGAWLVEQANKDAGTTLDHPRLLALLKGEPVTWNIHEETSPLWRWDLSRTRLRDFANVRSGEDYLAALEGTVGVAQRQADPPPLPPMALADAFDHLDLAWRLWQGKALLRINRTAVGAELAQPAGSRDEFRSRCSTLVDFINRLDVPPTPDPKVHGSLQRLDHVATTMASGHGGQAAAGVVVLRRIVALRNAQQHGGHVKDAEKARVDLGLSRFASDWSREWDLVRHAAVNALRDLRNAVVVEAEQANQPGS